MPIAIGVDVGGSHIACAAIDIETLTIIEESYYYSVINNKDTKELILQTWGNVINKTINEIRNKEIIGIGFAMPGPFNYKTGTALFKGNDKYESLYEVSIASELPKYLLIKNIPIRFLNDATAFGVGGSLKGGHGICKKVLAITLGTGFGAAFLNNFIPVVKGKSVPLGGCLWDKPFQKGIADDYFSTRWFISKYKMYSNGENVEGVKEIVTKNDVYSLKIFNEFAINLSDFLASYVLDFNSNLLVLGGSISKAHHLFLSNLVNIWKKKNINIEVLVLENTEQANIIGASYLFNTNFWETIKNDLPLF